MRSIRSALLRGAVAVAIAGCGRESDPRSSGRSSTGSAPNSTATAPTNTSAANPRLTPQQSHAKMVSVLEEIEKAVKKGNPYFGEAEIGDLEAKLRELPPQATKRRWRFEYLLGWNLTRLGRFEEAIEHLKVAHELSASIREYLESGEEQNMRLQQFAFPIRGQEATFDLGIAYLRFAESCNCQKHHKSESCILPIQGGGIHVDQEPAREALKCFLEVLAKYPDDLNTRWLANICAMAIGEFPNAVPKKFRLPPNALDSGEPFPHFTDIASEVGLNDSDPSGGAVIDDFDGDGDLDVITTSIDPCQPVHVQRHDADGSFENVTDAAGLAGIKGGLNLIDGDYDNDGDLDLFVLRGGWWKSEGRHPNSLLRNEGGLVFVDVTYIAGIAEPAYPTQTAAFGDYDNDGDLDLYVGNEDWEEVAAPSQLFRNEGNGTFVDVASSAGVENHRYAKGVVFADLDGDRFPDLYVSNYKGANRLYRNRGDGTFEDVAEKLGMTKPDWSFPVIPLDFDQDGALDLLVAGFWNHPSFIVPPFFGKSSPAELSCLYHNEGRGKFREIGESVGLTHPMMAMGANLGDLDNDGFPDVYLGTGYPNYDGIVPNVMLHNRDGKRWFDVSTVGGFAHIQKGHAVVFADLDQDGDQDVFEQMGGAFPGDGFSDVLFENPGNANHWLKVRLVGTKSNRFGVGARIRVDLVDGGAMRCIFSWVSTGGSFGCNPLRTEIGLGAAREIENLVVDWPTSGTKQEFQHVPADAFIEITEGSSEYRIVPLAPLPFKKR